MPLPRLCIVVPCYNEQDVLPLTAPLFVQELVDLEEKGKISPQSCVLLVNDGSADGTWGIIEDLSKSDARIQGVSLSRNRGHQYALLAGYTVACQVADIAISIDCDGQDDITAMERMVDAYAQGNDIVYGVRSDRSSDSAFKRGSAELFYRIQHAMGIESEFNHADYRLMSRRALSALLKYHEANVFLRGLIPLVGFSSTTVEYVRHERVAGESHYPFRKMLAFALDGITSFSIQPIRFITFFGIIASLLSFVGMIWAFVNALLGNTVSGWASLACLVCFMGGIQLMSLGIIGEYVGKTYLETKRRPRFFIEKMTPRLRGGQRAASGSVASDDASVKRG